jgi:hypothetical protein
MSRYVVKVIYLEKSEQLTIWNGGSTKLPAFSLERIAQID